MMGTTLDEMLDILRDSGKPVKHLGLAKSGDPSHPRTLGYATLLVLWH